MAESTEKRGVAWGVLVLRCVLGGILLAHGVLRLFPSRAQTPADLVFPVDVVGLQAAVVIVGAGELFVGLLVVLGLFLRLALLPLIAYLVAALVHTAKVGPLIAPGGSRAEEHLILLLIALSLLALGAGRISVERFFKSG